MADTLISKHSVEASADTTENITDALGSAESFTILSISICNTNASTDTTFKLWIDGTTPNTDAYLYYNQSLPAKSTYIHNSKVVLVEGDVLKFQTTAAVSCQIVVSMLKQTAVATSSGSDYLDRVLVYQTSTSAAVEITPNNTTHVKTVLGFTICSHEATNSTTFDLYARASGGGTTLIYQDQSLPALSTFEHSDKIILASNEELVFDQADSRNVSIVCSFLRQVP